MRALGFGLVDMEALRIEAPRKGLDLVCTEMVCAELAAVADPDVLEILHGASAGRVPKISGLVSAITRVPSWLIISICSVTKPISGRLLEARVSSTVTRMVSASP